jgi:hypothetical protein
MANSALRVWHALPAQNCVDDGGGDFRAGARISHFLENFCEFSIKILLTLKNVTHIRKNFEVNKNLLKNTKINKKMRKLGPENRSVGGGSASGFGPENRLFGPKIPSGPGIPEARRPH